MQNRWAEQKLKTCESAFLCLEAAWNQYKQATRGMIDALAAGTPISTLQQTYSLNWERVWEAIKYQNFWGTKSYQLWEWLRQGEEIQQRLLQIELLMADYRLQFHHNTQKAKEFWQGYLEGKTRCRTPYTKPPSITNSPTPHQKGELLGWRYAMVKFEIQTRLYCCMKSNADLFTWG